MEEVFMHLKHKNIMKDFHKHIIFGTEKESME